MKSVIYKQDFKKMSREQEWPLVEQKKKSLQTAKFNRRFNNEIKELSYKRDYKVYKVEQKQNETKIQKCVQVPKRQEKMNLWLPRRRDT